MDSFTLSVLLAFLWESGIIWMFILACVLVFLWEKFKIAIILFLILSAVMVGYYIWSIATKADRKQREELEKIREWSRRNKC